jgi:hypothetical protein
VPEDLRDDVPIDAALLQVVSQGMSKTVKHSLRILADKLAIPTLVPLPEILAEAAALLLQGGP